MNERWFLFIFGLVWLAMGILIGYNIALKPSTLRERADACSERNGSFACNCWMYGDCPTKTNYAPEGYGE